MKKKSINKSKPIITNKSTYNQTKPTFYSYILIYQFNFKKTKELDQMKNVRGKKKKKNQRG